MAERKIYFSPVFGRKLRKLKKQEKRELDEAVLEIAKDPLIEQAKAGDLSGVWVHKFKANQQQTLISYTFTDREIGLLTFGSHENFYRDLKKYRKP